MVKDSLHSPIFILHGVVNFYSSRCFQISLSHFHSFSFSRKPSHLIFQAQFSHLILVEHTHNTIPLLQLLTHSPNGTHRHHTTTASTGSCSSTASRAHRQQLLAGGQRLVDCTIFIYILCCTYSSVDDQKLVWSAFGEICKGEGAESDLHIRFRLYWFCISDQTQIRFLPLFVLCVC